MLQKSLSQMIWALLILGIYAFCWQIQSHLLLNWDVSWLTFAAQQLLAGGSYINNFLETNPPLIIYLYMPLFFLKSTFGISVIHGIILYVFLLSTLSLLACSRLLMSLVDNNQSFVHHAVLVILAFIFLLLPESDFGQREHLTVILTFPYLFLFALRLQSKQKPGILFASVVGFMAGIGFCIKPYFLLPLVFLELYRLYRSKTLVAALRPEVIAAGLFMGLYLLLITIFHQDYLHQIIPLIMQFYYQRYQRPLISMLLSEESVFNFFVLLFYWLRHKKQLNPDLGKTLVIAAFGFWLVYLGQAMGWYYHALPFFSLDLLLAVILFLPLAREKNFSKTEWLSTSVLILALMSYFFIKIPTLYLCAHFFPYSYFLFFFSVLMPLLYINADFKINLRLLYSLFLIFVINFIVYHYLLITIFYSHLFLLTALMFILSFGFFITAASSVEKCRYLLLAVLGLTLFTMPAYKMAYTYSYACHYKILYTELTAAMKKYSGKRVIYLSNASEMAFPNIDYSGQIYSSRFWSLIWLPTMNFPYVPETYKAYLEDNKDQLHFYMDALIADFKKNAPEIVFVDIRDKGYYYTPAPYYLSLFSLRKDFRELWKKYHYRETLDSPPLYKMEVYQRE